MEGILFVDNNEFMPKEKFDEYFLMTEFWESYSIWQHGYSYVFDILKEETKQDIDYGKYIRKHNRHRNL